MAEIQSARRRGCVLVAIVCVLWVFTWTVARVHYALDGNWTALFCTGVDLNVPPALEAGTYRFPGGGYDGQFYRYLAHDPFLQKDYYRYADSPQLRFRRLLIPLAAWALAFGQDGWIDATYFAVEMLFLALGGYWCARLFERRGRSPFWGILFVIVPATMASFDRMLVDGPLTALFAGFVLYCDEERWTRVWIVAMLAALTRDTGLLLIAALVTDRLLRRDWLRAVWFASGGIPAIAWYAYLGAHLPRDGALSIFAIPVWGFFQRLLWLRPYPNPGIQLLLRVTDVLAVLGLMTSMVLALRWIRDQRIAPVTLCVGLFVAMALVLGSESHMVEAFGFGRPVSPLLLWVMIEAISRKRWEALAPPLAVTLSVSLVFGNPLLRILDAVFGR